MKKLIAISVMMALVAGAAFAQVTIGGSMWVGGYLAKGDDTDDANMATAGDGVLGEWKVSMAAANDEGTFRGKVVAQFDDNLIRFTTAYAIWKPIPQLEVFFGADGDGKFQSANLVRYGFGQGGHGTVAWESWDGHRYLIGGWDGVGLALSILPIDMLTINLVLQLDGREEALWTGGGGFLWEDVGENIMIQADVTLPNDLGKLWITYWNLIGSGSGGYFWPYGGAEQENSIGLTYFNSSFVDGLSFEVGGVFRPENDANQISFGLGVAYDAGDFGVKFRGLFDINDAPNKETLTGKMNIMPWYKHDIAEFRCDIALRLLDSGDFGWGVNPYLLRDMGIGKIAAGVKIHDFDDSGNTVWEIPVSFMVSF